MFLRGKDGGRGADDDRNSRSTAAFGGATGDAVGTYEAHSVQSHGHSFSGSGSTGNAGNHNHGVHGQRDGPDPARFGLAVAANAWDSTPSSGDGRGNYYEMAIFAMPQAIPYSGDHAHSFSYSGTTGNAGGVETRPENMAVSYFIKL